MSRETKYFIQFIAVCVAAPFAFCVVAPFGAWIMLTIGRWLGVMR